MHICLSYSYPASVRLDGIGMETYNFWQDFFDTYQSLSDWMKFAWLAIPPVFALGLAALILRYRIARKRVDMAIPGDLIYTIHRDDYGELHIYRHDRENEQFPVILLLDPPNRDLVEPHSSNTR